MEERELKQKESLALIEKMIKTSQKEYNPYAGWHLLVWGYPVFFSAMLVALFFTYLPYGQAHLFWLLIPLIGAPASYIVCKKEKAVILVKGYIDSMVNSVSTVISIAIFTVMVGSYFVGLPVLPIIMLLSGVHCATIGLVTQYRLLTVMGVIGIFTSMIFYFMPQDVSQVYLFGISYLFLLCLPGHCLIYQNKKNRA